MRIISGNFKGKKILQPKDKLTRPLRDLAKESIFNVLNHSNKFNVKIKDSKFFTAQGASKKDAEQNAADLCLESIEKK